MGGGRGHHVRGERRKGWGARGSLPFMLCYDHLVKVAPDGLLGPGELALQLGGGEALDLGLPHPQREGLQPAEDERHEVPGGVVPVWRAVVLHPHHRAALLHAAQHVVHNLVLHLVGDLVQQHEGVRRVVGRLPGGKNGLHLASVPRANRGPGHALQLPPRVLALDGRHVHHREPPRGAHRGGRIGAQVPVGVPHLQHVAPQGKVLDHGTLQYAGVEEEDRVHDKLVVQKSNVGGVDVAPRVDLLHVLRNPGGPLAIQPLRASNNVSEVDRCSFLQVRALAGDRPAAGGEGVEGGKPGASGSASGLADQGADRRGRHRCKENSSERKPLEKMIT
eukprot:RCo043303